DPYWVQDQFETLQSKSILYQVITNKNLNKKWAEKFKEEGELRTEQTYRILRGKLDVSQTRNTSVLEIRVLSEDKDEAAELANEIAKVYRDSRIKLRNASSEGGLVTYKEQLKQKDEAIAKKEKQVNDLKALLNIPDV